MRIAALIAIAAGCYSPEVAPCLISCDDGAACPDHATCGADKYCHVDDGVTCTGHDEDGDAIDDAVDLCPHLAGSHDDRDGDRIGDDCDPEPSVATQRLLVFATMRPGDVPFSLTPAWTQTADAIHFNGAGHAPLDMMGRAYRNVRVAIGAEITRVPAPTELHQISLHAADAGTPHDFVEINELNAASAVQIASFSGTAYHIVMAQPLPARVHPGSVLLQLTAVVGGNMSLDGGWMPAETYHLEAPSGFTPGTVVHIDVNNLELDLRYLWAVAW